MKIITTRKEHNCEACGNRIPTAFRVFGYRDMETSSSGIAVRRYLELTCAKRKLQELVDEVEKEIMS